MNTTWVLVADSQKARLFEYGPDSPEWNELACMVNPEAAPARAIRRPPRVQESVGRARHIIEPRTSERDKQLDAFAATLAECLYQGHRQHRFQRLVIVAAPRFLGTLHKHLDKGVRQAVACELNQGLTALSARELRRRIPPQPAFG